MENDHGGILGGILTVVMAIMIVVVVGYAYWWLAGLTLGMLSMVQWWWE